MEIVTKDSDFNDLAICRGVPLKIIWVRLGNCKVDEIAKLIIANNSTILEFLNDKNSAILEI